MSPNDLSPVYDRVDASASAGSARSFGAPTIGWTEVAMAIHPLLTSPVPSLVRIDVAGHAPLTVDVEADAFWWQTPLAEFPSEPGDLRLSSEPKFGPGPSALEPGHALDGLLWRIGLSSFPGELAWWLQRDDRFRVVRWPNFTTLDHTPDQMRMTSMLGYAAMRVDELSSATGASLADARSLVNAFSLMRILRTEAPEAVQTRVLRAEPAAAAPKSLFRRLRDRLGI